MKRLLIGVLATVLLVAGLGVGVLAIGLGRQTGTVVGSTPGTPSSGKPATERSAASSEWLKEYTLTERSGRKFHSRELAGQVHVVNFFFAACPTVCRMQTAAVKSLAEEFGPEGVTFVSITCDPENDTPVALTLYAKEFNADPRQWLFLTGDLPYLRRVGAEIYFVPVDKQTHSESLLVLDRQGKIRGRFSWKKPAELADMKQLMRQLLAEPAGSESKS